MKAPSDAQMRKALLPGRLDRKALKSKEQPHALGYDPQHTMLSEDPQGQPMPVARNG